VGWYFLQSEPTLTGLSGNQSNLLLDSIRLDSIP
jgi:hypothetical protein